MPNFLGQHFLKNGAVIKKIIAALDIQPDETIIEIGPGHGELTLPLAAASEKIGAKIISIEKDKKLAEALQSKIKSEAIGNVAVAQGDALSFFKNGGRGSDVDATSGNFKLVGNIPYYITGHLLRIMSERETKPLCAILMIQQEVAERICAAPPRMNRLAASVQFWAEPEIIMQVPKTDFSPPPEVASAVIKLVARREEAGEQTKKQTAAYYAAVRALFAQPRKTILNNLADNDKKNLPKQDIADALAPYNINPTDRPQNLTVERIAKIAGIFFNRE